MFNFIKKNFGYVGSLLLGACIVPLYTYLVNFDSLRFLNVLTYIVIFSIIHLIVAFTLKLITRNDVNVIFILYFCYTVFWFSGPILYSIRDFIFKLMREYFNSTFCLLYEVALKFKYLLLFVFFVCFLLICIYFVCKLSKFVQYFNKFFNFFISTVFVIIFLQIAFLVFSSNSINSNNKILKTESVEKLPNIYHILLDGHPNEAAMHAIGGDLSHFYNELEKLGFTVYRDSNSNYYCTSLSVSSMLNMKYHNGDDSQFLNKEVAKTIANNSVFEALSKKYELHVNTTLNVTDALYGQNIKKQKYSADSYMQLAYTLFHYTCLKKFIEAIFNKQFVYSYRVVVNETLNGLFDAKELHSSSNHYFYSHIVCPHAPFIFGETSFDNAFSGFLSLKDNFSETSFLSIRNNVYGIDELILSVVSKILKQYVNEQLKPIIILHSDHSILYSFIGTKSNYVTKDTIYGNLLAIYMPDDWKSEAKDLKFINLYRFVLNHLLNYKYDYLEQKQIYKGKEY